MRRNLSKKYKKEKGGEPFLATTGSLVAPIGFGALAVTAGLVAAARLTPSKKNKKQNKKLSKPKRVNKSKKPSKKSVKKTGKKRVSKSKNKRKMINNKNK